MPWVVLIQMQDGIILTVNSMNLEGPRLLLQGSLLHLGRGSQIRPRLQRP